MLHGLDGTDLHPRLQVTKVDLLQTKTVEEYEHMFLFREKVNAVAVTLGDKRSAYHLCIIDLGSLSTCREALSKDRPTRLFVTLNDDFEHIDDDTGEMMDVLLRIAANGVVDGAPWEIYSALPALNPQNQRNKFPRHMIVRG